mmetsp:Transcript_24016/g.33058  ORF Transcript_24016/g.33058 Transcript_24016/m.33058 type:complete len:383 (-) Transcript_24016:199-1347(-)|eukprot:CAMPEP_0196589992 /NCGR_PEP_ID=MMETSP1081-20130531/65209_1 /TAXON_ID=36882 /ORGANISM="Pyramimonas amylifera, Strain CCMP720" /LENGTH=382 /DNA_ID=CAMNT_0041912955 /DNA_START=78 /DNA_END=1226 /DNA_ORIENTATION=+
MSEFNANILGPGWEHVRPLGKGSFGSVQLFRDVSTQKEFAVKFVERGEFIHDAIKKEVINHCMLQHENIARFKEVILCEKHLAIVMEYASGGDLFSSVQAAKGHKLTEATSRYYFQQLISGLGYVHSQGMCHRDMKLENLLLSGNPPRLKICDFGYSKSSKWQSMAKSKVGTAAYIAPEVIAASRGTEYEGYAVDVWSSGVVLHTMLVGMYPFCDVAAPNDEVRTVRRIMSYWKGEIPYGPPPNSTPETIALLQGMLTANPEKRITIPEIVATSWFQVNLPRGFDMCASPADPEFPQQSLEEVKKILELAVTPEVLVQPHNPDPTPGAQAEDLDRQESNTSEFSMGLGPSRSFNFADSNVASTLMAEAVSVGGDEIDSSLRD